jgi:GTP-binding protein of the ras superfamily involved in termination of M-phase
MDAPLIFNSSSHSVNVQKTFKIILSKVFNLECHVPTVEQSGDPILMY